MLNSLERAAALCEKGCWSEAESAYRQVLSDNADHALAHRKLGEVLYHQGRTREALAHMQQAHELDPVDLITCVNLAAVLRAEGRHEESDRWFQRIAEVEIQAAEEYVRVVSLLRRLGRRSDAVRLLERWLENVPEHSVASHMLAALTGENVAERCSDDYVRQSFDAFAASYDERLGNLNYLGPVLVKKALAQVDAAGPLDVLDAGCGTGLCGPVLRPHARRLTGVDLSGEMLARARQHELYDELVQAELTEYLSGCAEQFDGIVAADTLVYFGNLQPLLMAAAGALRPGGHLIFTVEHCHAAAESGYELGVHGRYAHRRDYLEQMLEHAGFRPPSIGDELLRCEDGQAVRGLLVIAQRAEVAPSTASTPEEQGPRDMAEDDDARAIEFYTAALEENPDHPRANFEIGLAYLASERYADAADAFQRSIDVMPHIGASHFNLANAQFALGRVDEAIASYQTALGLAPNAATHNNLGNCLASLRRFPEAIAAFESAIQLDPQFSGAHSNLGRALQRTGNMEAARAACQRAVELNGDVAATHAALGEILSEDRETMAQAAESFRQAIRRAPADPLLHAALGDALRQLGQLKTAAVHYVQALQVAPDDPALLNRMASLNLQRGQADEAAFCCLRALELAPGFHDAHRNLILAIQAEPQADPLVLMDHAKNWGQRFADVPQLTSRPSSDDLRIGYLAGDLTRPFRSDLLERLLCHHDAGRAEILIYADQISHDVRNTPRLADACQFVSHLDDLALAERIRDDGIHVLIDLCGQGDDHRTGVLARKPAMVQAGWLGHCGTTGLSAVDYLLADAAVLPPALADRCVETVLLLPASHAFFPVPHRSIEPGPVPARRNGCPTFGCVGNASQLNAELVRLWAGLVRGLPGSRLFLCMAGLEDESLREAVVEQLEASGVSSDRLRLEGWTMADERLNAYREMDLVLDPHPINGGLHVLEAIWMGTPVVGLLGRSFAGRTTGSFLNALDLHDFLVDSPEAYAATAAALAGDIQQLEALRRDLRPRLLQSALCDYSSFVNHLENACHRMRDGVTERAKGRS